MPKCSAVISLANVDDGASGRGVSSTAVTYKSSSNGTSAPTGTWSQSVPAVSAGNYLWTRTIITYTDGTSSTIYSVGKMGETGANGDKGNTGKGISSIVEYYAVSASNSTVPSSWGTSMPTLTATSKYLWNYTRYTYTDGTHVDTTKIVIGTYGDKGDKGATGSTGVGVSSIAEKYAVSSSNSTEPTSWQDTVPTLTATNRYLWNYEIFTLTNGTTTTTKKRVIGVYGDKGATGATGATGNGISSIVNYYLASASGSGITNASSGFTTTIQTLTATLKYLWNYELITYTNGTTAKSPACVIGVYGDKGATGAQGPKGDKGDTGNGISTIVEFYAVSASNTVAPTSWSTDVPTLSPTEKYLWNYTRITYTDESHTESDALVIGVYGDQGETGNGISSIAEKYAVSSSNSTPPSTWYDEPQTMTATDKYLWNYEIITYTNGAIVNTDPRIIGVYGDKGEDANRFMLSIDQNEILISARGSMRTQSIIAKVTTELDVSEENTEIDDIEGAYAVDQTRSATITTVNSVKKYYFYIRGTNLKTDNLDLKLNGSAVSLGDSSPYDDTEIVGFVELPTAAPASSVSLKALEALTVTEIYIHSSLIDWDVDDGQLIPIEYEQGKFFANRRLLLCDTVVGESSTITASFDEYSVTVKAVKVTTGDASPKYLGSMNEVPDQVEGDNLIEGDHFLFSGLQPDEWASGASYTTGQYIQGTDYYTYRCIANHTSATSNRPVSGSGWDAVWVKEAFSFGRIYLYNGAEWHETQEGQYVVDASIDALKLAMDTGKVVYIAMLYVDTITTARMIVQKYIQSVNWATDGDDVPTSGFYLDGIRGVLRSYGIEAYGADIHGWLESDGFRTIREQSGVTIPTTTIAKTLYKWDDMASMIPSSDNVLGDGVSGNIGGIAFNRITRRNNQRILLCTHPYESHNIVAGNGWDFSKVYPSLKFGSTLTVNANGMYYGFLAQAILEMANSSGNLVSGAGQHIGDNARYDWWGSRSFNASGRAGVYVRHYSGALWGNRSSYVNYVRVYTPALTGLVLMDCNPIADEKDTRGVVNSYHVVEVRKGAYLIASLNPFEIGSSNQSSITDYVSGSDFYDHFVRPGRLGIGAKGFMSGEISVTPVDGSATTYIINRLENVTNQSITFGTDKGSLTIDRFTDGGSIGAYLNLQVTSACVFSGTTVGIETKHIMPMGTDSVPTGNDQWVIGQQSRRYVEAWIKNIYASTIDTRDSTGNGLLISDNQGLEIFGSTPFVDFHFDRSSTDYTSRIIEESSGKLSVSGSMAIGNSFYFKPTTQFESDTVSSSNVSKTISAMAIGEHKLFKWKHRNTYSGSRVATIVFPSGGNYLITYRYITGQTDVAPTIVPGTSYAQFGPFVDVIAGGASVSLTLDDAYRSRVFFYVDLWRLS